LTSWAGSSPEDLDMKIALVIPRNVSENEKSYYDYKFFSKFMLTRIYYSYMLAIPTLASLTPSGNEIRVFDENIEDLDYGWKPDLVGISVSTMLAKRAYQISATFRKLGAKTVLGGIHPSMCPEESIQHCDAVVVGEAEKVWHTVLEDAQNGRLAKTYKADALVDLSTISPPDRSLIQRNKYINDFVQTTKGCPFHCEFCSVHAFDGQKIRNKPVENVVEEIKGLNLASGRYKSKGKAIFFADDNIIANIPYARTLFEALRPLNVKWGCQASINLAQHEDLMGLMREAGCGSVFIGFESISEKNLSAMSKNVNMRHNYMEAINRIQSHGLLILGSFIVGYDFDTRDSFDELIHFIDKANILEPVINILTPFPGTRLFQRFEAEGRIIHKDWSKYDTKHVVFKPVNMTPEELLAGYEKVNKSVYSFDHMYRKFKHFGDTGFWLDQNEADPIKLQYRILFALRMFSLLFSSQGERSKFIIRVMPKIFSKRYRITKILQLLAYNDHAYD
jgi:radical SAM superfamily enzyme YgiQ (UPF0313 family)